MSSGRRYEIKFCCRYDEVDCIYNWLCKSPHSIQPLHAQRYVNNIYFDWFDFQDASDNLIGLGRREKLRLRWYGDQNAAAPMHLERKNRHNSLGSKHILDLDTFSVAGMSKHDLTQRIIAHDPDSPMLKLDLRLHNPVVRNRYLREYYQDHSGKLRLTIDRQQLFFAVDRDYDVLSANAIDYPVIVIEAKYADVDLPDVRNIMKGFPLRPIRHSKYLAGLARVLERPYF
jgi:VTC domain